MMVSAKSRRSGASEPQSKAASVTRLSGTCPAESSELGASWSSQE